MTNGLFSLLNGNASVGAELKGTKSEHFYCSIRLYPWAKGSLIKLEGVNLGSEKREELLFSLHNESFFTARPTESGYMIAVFFTDRFTPEKAIGEKLRLRLSSPQSGRMLFDRETVLKKIT